MIMDHYWNDTDRGRQKCSEVKLVHCKIVELKSDVTVGEPVTLR